MANGKFVSLHNHTELGSPLDGMNDVYDLFLRAKEIDHPAIAITDHGTLTALHDARLASIRTGVKLIPGIEAYFAPDMTVRKSNHMVLLAKNHTGYKNLLRLNYESYKNQVSGYMGKMTPRITWEHIEEFNEGVVALSACANGVLSKMIMADNESGAIDNMLRLKSIFGDNFFLELQPHSLKTSDGKVDQIRVNETLVRLSNDYDVPYVVTCDAHYKDKYHAKYHDMMLAIKDKKALDDPDRFRYGVQDMYLKTHEEVESFFGREVSNIGMANSIKISEMCEDPAYIDSTGPVLPDFDASGESDYRRFVGWRSKHEQRVSEPKDYLRYKCIQGFKDKLGHLSADKRSEYWDRVKKELEVLEAKDFSSYMLIVSDYINWAKGVMPVGPARGSSAGSLVAFLVGITNIDPIKYGLIFERFHNNQKESFPDIDTDFSRPDLVKEYIKLKYGEDRVASISNWSTLSPKVTIKDVARSLRLGGDKSSAFKIANAITSIMPDEKSIEASSLSSSEFDAYMQEYPELGEYACKLQNLTRNWSVHAAGVVIGERPLYESVPLRIDKDGAVVTQWEKTRCEDNGLIKMDILGLKTLTVIDNALSMIHNNYGLDIDIASVDLEDQAVYDMIGAGRTLGVFQLESSLTPLCMKIKPRGISDISDINALGRPSCSPEQRKLYIKRRLGLEDVSYRHPSLERALGSTYGVSLYEESMMFIAQDCAGWDLNQADALRKITKLKGKDPDLVLRTEASFISDCMNHIGVPYNTARAIWDDEIAPYGSYGFNRSHSISYSHISYYTAWLKHHYPDEFMAALINSEDPNSDKVQEYINECSKIKIEILPPDVSKSLGVYAVVEKGVLSTGLSAVKGMGEKAIDEIVNNQPYSGVLEFFAKTSGRVVNKRVLEYLAKSGSFDSFGTTRKDMHDNYSKYRTKANSIVKKEGILDDSILSFVGDEWSRKEILLGEKESMGRSISGSLHEVFRGFFREGDTSVTPLSRVDFLDVNSKIKVEVIVNSMIKEFKIKNGSRKGDKFAKYSIEDVSGDSIELTVWSEQYKRIRTLFKDGVPVKAVCKVDEYMGKRGLSLVRVNAVYGNV
jgi:DNA polymerase-3 subunit alpha